MGFVLPQELMFCGDKIYTQKDFFDTIENYKKGVDNYVELRKFLRKLQFSSVKGNASQNIKDLIES